MIHLRVVLQFFLLIVNILNHVNPVDNTNNVEASTEKTAFCIEESVLNYTNEHSLKIFDVSSYKYNSQKELKCCIDDNNLCVYYDPCLVRKIKAQDNVIEKVYMAFVGGKYTNSDFSVPYNSKTNKNQNKKINVCSYNYTVEIESDHFGFIWIQLKTSNCDPKKLPKPLECDKRYISAIFRAESQPNKCSFLQRLGKEGSIKFLVTFIVAPIIAFLMVSIYAVFVKRVLLFEYKNIYMNNEIQDDTTTVVELSATTTAMNGSTIIDTKINFKSKSDDIKPISNADTKNKPIKTMDQ